LKFILLKFNLIDQFNLGLEVHF